MISRCHCSRSQRASQGQPETADEARLIVLGHPRVRQPAHGMEIRNGVMEGL